MIQGSASAGWGFDVRILYLLPTSDPDVLVSGSGSYLCAKYNSSIKCVGTD